MSAANYRSYSFKFYNSNGYPVAPYQIVTLAGASDVTAANAAGISGVLGDIVVLPTLQTSADDETNFFKVGFPKSRIVGVTVGPSNPITGEVAVAVSGIFKVMANAAVAAASVAEGLPLFPVAGATRTSAQTPLTSMYSLLLPTPPEFVRTYNLCAADDTAVTPADPASTPKPKKYYPVGYALGIAGAQYDVIPIEILPEVFYA